MRPQCTLSRCQPRCFNPRTPCGVRLNIESSSEEEEEEVSIHALLAECDHQPGWGNDDGTCFNPRTPCGVRQSLGLGAVDHGLFQSTHSLRSATQVTYVGGNWDQVSIHALLAECDQDWHVPPPQISGFNPRTPCGVRREPRNSTAYTETFQSTHSLRSATWRSGLPYCLCPVSIHALLRPTLYIATQQSKSYFAPTSLKRPSLHGCSF